MKYIQGHVLQQEVSGMRITVISLWTMGSQILKSSVGSFVI